MEEFCTQKIHWHEQMNMHNLQEPVKRNPTHAQFHPALSFMLLCCNHLAITLSLSLSPPLSPAGHKGRKEAWTAREQRTTAGLGRSPEGSSQWFSFNHSGDCELTVTNYRHMCDVYTCQGLISSIPTHLNRGSFQHYKHYSVS